MGNPLGAAVFMKPNLYLKNVAAGNNDTIFSDDFETGDASRWSSNVSDGGDLSTSIAANYWGDYGLQAVVDDSNAIFVQDDTPDAEKTYKARFYINPAGYSSPAGIITTVFAGYNGSNTQNFVVNLQKLATGVYQVRAGALDGSTWMYTSWADLPSGSSWNAVEIDHYATDELGTMQLWVNGSSISTLSSLNNTGDTIQSVRLGIVGLSAAGATGVINFDDFESRRYSYIGLLPEKGLDDPQPVQEAGWTDKVYTYGNNQPHAVTSVTSEVSSNSYQYDANGNMTQRVENGVTWTHTYNAENRLASLNNGTTTWLFSYDGNGNRVSHLITDGITSTVTYYFMGGGYEVTSDGVTSTVRKYYAIAGADVCNE